MSALIEYYGVESYRNQRTGGGVVIWQKKDSTSGIKLTSLFVKCTEHGVTQDARNISIARKLVHRPWTFCDKCHKIAWGYSWGAGKTEAKHE